MKTKIIYSAIIGFAISISMKAQDATPKFRQDEMLWFGYYNSIIIDQKWSINSDLQGRTKNWYKDWSQALIRTGLSYKANDKITLSAGVAHFRFFITNSLTRGEWRPWQEVALSDKVGKMKLTHRFRFEQRFNQKTVNNEPVNDYQFNYRFRYKLDLSLPIKKTMERGHNLYLLVGNEIMLNAGPAVTNNYFDQNRLYGGLNYEIDKKLTIQLHYMHIWQILSDKVTLDNVDVIRFNICHSISL